MIKLSALIIFVVNLILVFPVLARVTPNDIYQQTRTLYQTNLEKITDSSRRQSIERADRLLKEINLRICQNFDVELAKMAAILEEEKSRRGVTETRVAYGQGDTPLDDAAYSLNYAGEAVAYQKIQDYTPQIGGNLRGGVNSSLGRLTSDLAVTKNKILRAKAEIKKALDYYEK